MEHVGNVIDTLTKYFNVLEQTGSYGKRETYGLLLYCFVVDQVLDGPLSPYLDDAGLDAFNKMLRCLYNNGCLIRNPEFIRFAEPRAHSLSGILRSSEDSTQRFTESELPRRVE